VEELEKVIDSVIFMKNGQIAMTGDVEELRVKTGKSVVELYRDIYRDHAEA
jgi:ABC-2 type transport system ATP-binding protein